VAAARQVLMTCEPAQIDGYTFCIGLRELSIQIETVIGSHKLTPPVTCLIRQAILRPKSAKWWLERTSLEICPLVELVDMYHAHEATERHDKIFALLGMTSDDPTEAGLLPNYHIPWQELFMNLLRFVFGGRASIAILGDSDLVTIQVKGSIIGTVLELRLSSRTDRQDVIVTIWDSEKPFATKTLRSVISLCFDISTTPVCEGDIICLLEDNPTPVVVRACKGYFRVVKIAAIAKEAPDPLDCDTIKSSRDYGKSNFSTWVKLLSIKTFPRDLLLVWDWEVCEAAFQCQSYAELEAEWCRIRSEPATEAERLSNAALILAESGRFLLPEDVFPSALDRHGTIRKAIQGSVDFCRDSVGNEHLCTLRCMDALGMICTSSRQWKDAADSILQAIQTRIQVQGAHHHDTLSSISILADLLSALRKRQLGKAYSEDNYKMEDGVKEIVRLLRISTKDKVTEQKVLHFAGSLDVGFMKFLLAVFGHEFKITEDVLKAAVTNHQCALDMTNLLLNERKDELKITEEVLSIAASKPFGDQTIPRFLEEKGVEFRITEAAVEAAAGSWNGAKMISRFLRERGHEFKITEAVIQAAAMNIWCGAEIISQFLHERGDEFKITQKIIQIVVLKGSHELLQLLIQQRGDEFLIIEEIMLEAKKWKKSKRRMELLLKHQQKMGQPKICTPCYALIDP
jgi:hypothetical protein